MADPEPHDAEAGGWIVETASGSTYLLDPQAGTVCRLRGEDAGQLRGDSDAIPLLRFTTPVVGRPMVLLLQVRKGCLTVRTTTPVARIDRRSPPAPGIGTSAP